MTPQERRSSTDSSLVLVVDDDPEMRAVLRDSLVREGFTVSEQTGGERVIAMLESVRPAAVVLDKEIPGPDGLDLLVYITRRHPAVPVFVITAFGGPAVQAEALHRGAIRYFEKPFRVRALIEALHALDGARNAHA